MIRHYITSENTKENKEKSIETYCKIFMKLEARYTPAYREGIESLIGHLSDRRAERNGHPEAIAFIDLEKEEMRVYV